VRVPVLAFLSLAALQAAPPSTMRAWFPDGTSLEIYTEATGSTQLNATGSIGIGPGDTSKDLVNRSVLDRENHVLFAYNIEASRGASPNTVTIRILPISAATEAGMLKRAALPAGAHLPTVAAVREFPAVKIGEVVTLEILYNPSTGEKVFDVLRPSSDPAPYSNLSVGPRPARESISLKEIVVRVNGQPLSAPASWMIGSAIRIDLPNLGAYVVSAYDPKTESPGHAFAAVARADGKTLSWTIDGKYIEIASSTNVLTQSFNAVLWVYHDARYRSQDQPDAVRLQSADSVDWLLPRKADK
jgi:hypothetical protein